MDFVDLYKEMEALERRVNMQSRHIQQVKLEIDGGEFQSEEQLEEAGVVLEKELAEDNLLEEEAVQQLIDQTAELDSPEGWQVNTTGDQGSKGDQVDLPFDVYEEEDLQPSRLQRKSQPTDQLEEVLEEIRKMMLRPAEETVSRRKLSRI